MTVVDSSGGWSRGLHSRSASYAEFFSVLVHPCKICMLDASIYMHVYCTSTVLRRYLNGTTRVPEQDFKGTSNVSEWYYKGTLTVPEGYQTVLQRYY